MIHEFEEYEDDDEVEYYAIRPNKTQIKKDIGALVEMCDVMTRLSAEHLDNMGLPEKIFEAVKQAAGMPHTGARKRLLKFAAQQLHKMDVAPFQEKLARIQNKSAHAVREHHLAEKWRERLIKDGQNALTELIDLYPEIDAQHVRQLIRNIHKETAASAPPKSSRLLYRYLKDLLHTETVSDDEEFKDEDEENDRDEN